MKLEPWMYIALLGAVVIVFASMKPGRRKESAAPDTTIKQIEETMDHFTSELEEENRQLLELISEMKHDHEKHAAKLQGRMEALERHNLDVTKQLDRLLQAEAQARAAEAAPAPAAPVQAADKGPRDPGVPAAIEAAPAASAAAEPAPEPQTGMNIRHRYADLFKLEKQGKSIDQIAKKLGMNKGEVMLILQLAKQEDRIRV